MSVTIKSFAEAVKVPFDLDGRILLTTEGCELVHLTLQAGEVLAPHHQPFDVIFHLLEGTGILTVGTEEHMIEARTSVGLKTGILRGWRNPGPDELKLLVIKLLSNRV